MALFSKKENYPDLSRFDEARRKHYEMCIEVGWSPEDVEALIKEDDEFHDELMKMAEEKK